MNTDDPRMYKKNRTSYDSQTKRWLKENPFILYGCVVLFAGAILYFISRFIA